jgi:hypothetical protein
MNVEIGTEAPIFLFWEYLFQIFGILSLQCVCLQYRNLAANAFCCQLSNFMNPDYPGP